MRWGALTLRNKPIQRMTTGRKYIKRTKGTGTQRVIDARTRTILNAVLSEPRGSALAAYLKAGVTK